MPEPSMTPEEVDLALGQLGTDFERIAERLVALDGHPGHRVLESAQLVGDSQRRWAQGKATIATLWAQFDAYREVLNRAREIRARRARPGADELVQLSTLLRGRSVELPVDHGADATLTAPQTERISLGELVARMRAAYQPVLELVTRASDAWSLLASRLDPLTERVAQARSATATLGGVDSAELSAVEAQLAALRTEALSDPLAQHGDLDGRLRATAAQLDRITERLAELQRLREGYPRARAGLASRIDEVAELEATARRLRDTVIAKIAGPVVVAVPAVTGRLRELADRLDELHRQQRWDQLARRLTELDVQTAEALRTARAAADNLQQLLDRRAELRGRLEAYRAKAGRMGYGEHTQLAELHQQARDLLWTAPCDLAAATRAVASYQQAILALTAGPGEVVP